jgi:hypothetical protein
MGNDQAFLDFNDGPNPDTTTNQAFLLVSGGGVGSAFLGKLVKGVPLQANARLKLLRYDPSIVYIITFYVYGEDLSGTIDTVDFKVTMTGGSEFTIRVPVESRQPLVFATPTFPSGTQPEFVLTLDTIAADGWWFFSCDVARAS